MNVSLGSDLRDFVREKVRCGHFPSEEAVLREAVRRIRQADQAEQCGDKESASADLIDLDSIEYCNRAVQGKEVPSIDEVRKMLSNISGSMAEAVIAERASRS
jgi:putative addiction module CopG family antidote